MDWKKLTVNDILEDEITKIDCTLKPPRFNGDARTFKMLQDNLVQIINDLGKQSAAAQGLTKIITTTDKLRMQGSHRLYLLKDERGKEGKGEVIGLLKVGRKHLFLYDELEQVHEVEPMCVLDFYIQPSRQRLGYGRLLFDHMLQDLELKAIEMAIDGPSQKMEQFLASNYGIVRLMRQNNNFAVAPEFFQRSAVRTPALENKSSLVSSAATAATPTVGRFSATRPAEGIGAVIHGSPYEDKIVRYARMNCAHR